MPFLQALEKGAQTNSPETSSRRLVWRPCSHGTCRRRSQCTDHLLQAGGTEQPPCQSPTTSSPWGSKDKVNTQTPSCYSETAGPYLEQMDTDQQQQIHSDKEQHFNCFNNRNSPCSHNQSHASAQPQDDSSGPPRFFTLNANIQPFDAFSIRHDLTGKHVPGSQNNNCKARPGCCQHNGDPCCASVNLTVCHPRGEAGKEDSYAGLPVEVLPNGQGLMYTSRVELPEEGAEACLGKLDLRASIIYGLIYVKK